jgi:hypothetical protein
MKLNKPKNVTWWIAVVLGVLGLIAKLGVVSALAPFGFWLVFVGLALLALANAVKGL